MERAVTIDELAVRGAAARQAALAPALVELHRRVLRTFVMTGRPSRATWLADHAEDLGLDPVGAVDGLAAADLVHVADGAVLVAYPFSGKPTRHLVEMADRSVRWAMCAIDALGISFLADQDLTITTADPYDNRPVRITRAGGEWMWQPGSAVVTAGNGPSGSCEYMNFHTDETSAVAYLGGLPDVAGSVLDQRAALDLANRLFGRLLTGQ